MAAALATCLLRLADVDPLLSRWRRKGLSRATATASAVLVLDAAALVEHLASQHRDDGQAEMPELGFSFAAWNGERAGSDAAFSCTVGLHAQNAHLRNSVALSVPDALANDSEKLRAVATVLVEVWEPDEVVVRIGAERTRLWP